MATVSDTDELRGTDREPRLALSLTLERTVAGLPSVAELASLIGVVTMIFELADPDGALRAATKRSGPTVQAAHAGAIMALVVIEREDAPLIVTADVYASLRSWQLDGTPGDYARDFAHHRPISALVVVEHHGHGGAPPLIISASDYGELRSWRLDGSPGELQRDDAHHRAIMALAVIDHDGAPRIISGDTDGALRSWRRDGSPGELQLDRAHPDWISALAVVEHHRAPPERDRPAAEQRAGWLDGGTLTYFSE